MQATVTREPFQEKRKQKPKATGNQGFEKHDRNGEKNKNCEINNDHHNYNTNFFRPMSRKLI